MKLIALLILLVIVYLFWPLYVTVGFMAYVPRPVYYWKEMK